MTSQLHNFLTQNSAAFLREALSVLNRDSFLRYDSNSACKIQPLQIAFDWKAEQNEAQQRIFLKSEKKRLAHTEEMDSKFRDGVQYILENYLDQKNTAPPLLGWSTHFANYPLPCRQTVEAPAKNTADMSGSLVDSLAWSDHNRQRILQHKITVLICGNLIKDVSIFEHLAPLLAHVRHWTWSTSAQLDTTRLQLVLLEGHSHKIQALREEILNSVCRQNLDTSHFYSALNGQAMSNLSSEQRFKEDVLRHVQAGVMSSHDLSLEASIKYSDLGLN